MKVTDLDKMFDSGEVDITPYLDLAKAARPGYAQKMVNVDSPVWLLEKLDQAAERITEKV